MLAQNFDKEKNWSTLGPVLSYRGHPNSCFHLSCHLKSGPWLVYECLSSTTLSLLCFQEVCCFPCSAATVAASRVSLVYHNLHFLAVCLAVCSPVMWSVCSRLFGFTWLLRILDTVVKTSSSRGSVGAVLRTSNTTAATNQWVNDILNLVVSLRVVWVWQARRSMSQAVCDALHRQGDFCSPQPSSISPAFSPHHAHFENSLQLPSIAGTIECTWTHVDIWSLILCLCKNCSLRVSCAHVVASHSLIGQSRVLSFLTADSSRALVLQMRYLARFISVALLLGRSRKMEELVAVRGLWSFW